MFLAIPQRPPHFRRVGFRPPTVQFREIDASVDEHLHTACPARFPGTSWRVNPDIYPLHEVLGQKHVVVTEEDNMGTRFGTPNETASIPESGPARPGPPDGPYRP